VRYVIHHSKLFSLSPSDNKGILKVEVQPIGIVHSPFKTATGTPVQPFCAAGSEGWIEIEEQYLEGLKDLDGYQRIWLIYWCHRASQCKLTVVPYRDTKSHGVFATRAPARPNPIGISSVRIDRIEGNKIFIKEFDVLDGSPILDIKPYISQYDSYPNQRSGWLEIAPGIDKILKADARFEKSDS
jgi:tRNA (adenine37-N6)-methyltransferase